MNRFIALVCAVLVAILPVESYAQQVTGPTTRAVTQAASDNSTKIATTQYVTTGIANAIAAVNPAVAVSVATTAAGDTSGLTYSNGVAGIGATFTGTTNTALTFDGVTLTSVNQRVLIKNDTQSPSGSRNGVYYLTQIQTAILPPILTRALDYDQPSDINYTGGIPVIAGTTQGNTLWLLTTQVTTIGTDPLSYTQFSPVTGATTLISCQSPSSTTTVTFNSIPGTYNQLQAVIYGRSTVASLSEDVFLRFNNDSGNNYNWQLVYGNTATTAAAATTVATSGIRVASLAGSTATANYFGGGNIVIPAYANTTGNKVAVSEGFNQFGTSNTQLSVFALGGQWLSTTAVTRVDFVIGGNWVAGSRVCLYGIT